MANTFLSPIEEYNQWVKKTFENRGFTNCGAFAKELQTRSNECLAIDRTTPIMNNADPVFQITVELPGNGGKTMTTPMDIMLMN